ncbi:acyl-CoA thioesterase [Neobacillus sp. K501]
MAFSEMEIIAESSKFHVSNVQMYQYLDEARKDWYQYCISVGVEAVLVHIGADFKKEIFNQDLLRIRTWLERVGNTSFTLKQTVMNQGDDLIVSAEVVLATIDREKRTKVRVPNEVRSLLNDPSALDINVINRVLKKS